MIQTLHPTTRVQGEIRVPGDKSVSHRAAIFGSVAHGTTRISSFLKAHDTQATLQCLRELGLSIGEENEQLVVEGRGFEGLRAPNRVLDCGNSGTTMRLLLGVLAGCPFETTIGGDASLSRRPMDRVRVPLSQMGADVVGQGERNTPPLTVRGGSLKAIEYAMPVASAQVKSCVLLAGLQARGKTTVIEPSPARDHTERMLRAFGVEVSQENNRVSVEGNARLQATDVRVPGDISSAAFFFVAGALRPSFQVRVLDVGVNPTRTGILDVLRAMGARVELENPRESGGEPIADVTIRGGDLKATQIGGALIPRLIDELPVLALLATQCEGTTTIRDAQEMRVKESDRIAIISQELRKLGAHIEEQPDGMTIHGPAKLMGATVTSPPGDHRIAMTLAIASLICEGETTLENSQAVTSSFPNFFSLLDEVRA
ncbi:MAG TPA: 3-phosphoshikimate 1-carboxyvinyltransferase [Abditibacteriaceae bacterium]|nr:3-phosphoshikimate 1-carboxyvinyltransferase [Abditibacteriaceae bacterium]